MSKKQELPPTNSSHVNLFLQRKGNPPFEDLCYLFILTSKFCFSGFSWRSLSLVEVDGTHHRVDPGKKNCQNLPARAHLTWVFPSQSQNRVSFIQIEEMIYIYIIYITILEQIEYILHVNLQIYVLYTYQYNIYITYIILVFFDTHVHLKIQFPFR